VVAWRESERGKNGEKEIENGEKSGRGLLGGFFYGFVGPCLKATLAQHCGHRERHKSDDTRPIRKYYLVLIHCVPLGTFIPYLFIL
jgi:hypothetical protein